MKISIEQIAKEDGRYDAKALKFIYDGLGFTIQQLRENASEDEPRHISGAELTQGIARLAQKRWGWLAKMVLNQWGVHNTRDMGEIVYLMIRYNWMTAQESDEIEDFDNIYDFEQMFEKQYRFEEN